MDIRDLMSATQPQMMPNAPSPLAGLMYGQDKARNDSALAQGATLAALQAKMAAMDAEEKAAGAPGRMSEIRVKNAEGADDESQLGSIIAGRRQKRDTGMESDKAKQIQDQLKGIAPWVDSWQIAKPEDKVTIQQMMRDNDVSFGNKKLGEMDPQELDKAMGMLAAAKDNSEKMRVEAMKQSGATERAKLNIAGRNDVANLKAKLAEKLRSMPQAKDKSVDNVVADILKKPAKDRTDDELEVMDFYAHIKTYGADSATARAPGTAKIDEKGNVVRDKPTPPPAPRVSGGEAAKFKVGDVKTDKNGVTATFMGGDWKDPKNWKVK